MIKNKYTIICSLMIMVFAISGCSSWLDVKPESQIILDEYWRTETDVDNVLNACYRGLTEDDVIYRMIAWGELRSDNLTVGIGFPTKRYDLMKILNGDIISTNSYSSWGAFYKVINYCNTLLKYAPEVLNRDNNFTVDDLHKAQAEARAIRGLCYFYLVRAFKEVPYVTDASIDDTQDYAQPKVSERALLDSITADLVFAKQYAKSDFGDVRFNKGRITLNSVNAILADVYLWDQQYDKCVEACDEVLADKKLKLVAGDISFSQIFYLKNSAESIFELQFSENVQINNPVVNLYGSYSLMLGELSFPANLAFDSQKKVAAKFSPFVYKLESSSTLVESENDNRAKDFYRSISGSYIIFKYPGAIREEDAQGNNYYGYRMNTANWILYRLADVMLMKAEAQVQLKGDSNFVSAINLVNKTYLRSNPTADSLRIENYNDESSLGQLVLRERQRELLFEGKRWFDLVRLARREKSTATLNNFVNHKISGTAASIGANVLDAMYMPISRSELEANPSLTQNPYYLENTSSSR